MDPTTNTAVQESFQWMPLAQAALYSFISIIFMTFAKLISNLMTPYDDDAEIKDRNNVSVAIRTVGFFAAVVIGMAGALKNGVPQLGREALVFILDGAVVLVSLIVAQALINKVAFPKVDFTTQAKNNQVCGGIVEASLFVATAFILHGVFGSEGGNLLSGIAWVFGGQLLLILSVLLYNKLAPFNVAEELSKANAAAGLAIGARALAVAIILRGVLDGDSSGVLKTDALYVGVYFVFGMLLLSAANFIADLLFLPHYRIKEAIVEKQNVAAVAKIAGVQIAIAIVVASVL